MSDVKTFGAPRDEHQPDIGFRSIITCAIDDVALASLRREQPEELCCSLCDAPIGDNEPVTSGLLLWTRGDDIRFDEPPVCASCSASLMVSAYARWYLEEEGDE